MLAPLKRFTSGLRFPAPVKRTKSGATRQKQKTLETQDPQESAQDSAAQTNQADLATRPFALKVREGDETLFEQGFPEGDFLIGASLTADIVIPELIVSEAAILHFEKVRQGSGMIKLTALAEGVKARGRELALSEAMIFPGQATFSIGPFLFGVRHHAPPAPLILPGRGPLLLIGGALIAGLAAWLMGRTPSGSPQSSPPIIAYPSLPQAPLTDLPLSPSQRLAAAETELKSRLVGANLSPPLTLTRERNSLIITGIVGAEERIRVSEVISTFRQRFAVPVEMALTSDPDPVGFVVAVALKPEAYVLGRDGRRYMLRQRLPDGGVIEEIDATSVLIDREGLKERVIYAR
jgi:hypothetical protein